MDKKRPTFKKQKGSQSYASPEELFVKLPNREKTHGYLRAPQVDALREYQKLQKESDVAFELPTGTGKTLVGLLVAEWRRQRTGEKVAYLTLTNQLAKQVLSEANNLGIDCADITGTKDTRDVSEVGRYKAALAIGVTTYSNLFNVNPVVQASDVLIFDDAHGGEHFVADMWTVRVSKQDNYKLYNELLTGLRPRITDNQFRVITDGTEYGAIEIVDFHSSPAIVQEITALLDSAKDASIRFPWSLLRNNIFACHIFASINEIALRPLVPPTHTHEPFYGSKQRIYLSATLGGEGDLLRSYGVTATKPIRVQHAQWGKRYIFVPGLYMNEKDACNLVANVWNQLEIRRALLLAPSFNIAQKTFDEISHKMKPKPVKLESKDIEDSIEPFTRSDRTILCLAGRYDGLDLPGDDCRLLIMAESPGAIGVLERHLREHWKLGPLLRRRERVRLIQGMGRCTRDATDYAIILLLGQSLIDSVTAPVVVQGLPGEIQRELKWGIDQGQVARENKSLIAEMIMGLLTDSRYRKEANASFEDIKTPKTALEPKSYDEGGKLEVQYSRALWDGNYSTAYKIARDAADRVTTPELAGYSAWWLYLAAIAAHYLAKPDTEIDCLKRARVTGINAGLLDHLLRDRSKKEQVEVTANTADQQSEAIWDRIDKWGWHGPTFGEKMKEMQELIASLTIPTKYHMGLENLGSCVGAEVLRPTEQGAPDVVWIYPDYCVTFEAKSNKAPKSDLSKSDVQQAKGHPDWLRGRRNELKTVSIIPLIVAPTKGIDSTAKPHAGELNYVSTATIIEFAHKVSSGLNELRLQFAGKEYGAVIEEFKVAIKQKNIHLDAIKDLFKEPLLKT